MMRILDQIEAQMLMGLWHLRYLSTEQIYRLWYGNRSFDACVKRLSRLGGDGLLARRRLPHPKWSVAWSLGTEGLQELRRLFEGEWGPSKAITDAFVPHLLETNEIFVSLAPKPCGWEALPFDWAGSHRVALSFRVSGKERVIRPDAMLVHHAARRRVFIELDRSTECLSPQDGRRSITRKLEGYRTFLHGRASDARRWSEHVFADGYATRVLFVLSRRDSRAHDPENRDRRLRGILHRAAEVFGCADQSPIRCVYLDDAPGIAKVARLDAAHAEAPPPRRATVSSDEVTALSDLYDSFIALFQRVRRESRAREHARTVGRRARAVLERMQPDRKLSDPATFPGVRL